MEPTILYRKPLFEDINLDKVEDFAKLKKSSKKSKLRQLELVSGLIFRNFSE